MERLKPRAATVLVRLITKMKSCSYMKIALRDYSDLVLEKFEVLIHTPAGTANLYRLAHELSTYQTHFVGPEMVFLIIHTPKDGTSVIPVSYKDMYTEMEVGIQINANQVMDYDKELQAGHACFANIWLRNINSQGFLSVGEKDIYLALVA